MGKSQNIPKWQWIITHISAVLISYDVLNTTEMNDLRIPKTICLEMSTWEKIDQLRSNVSRSAFISKILADGLIKLEKQ